MSINATQFRQFVLNPALDVLVPAGIPRHASADALVLATIAQESLMGTWLAQDGGPALGIGQIEPASLSDLWRSMSQAEHTAVNGLMTPEPLETQLPTNLKLACALVRLFYWHKPFPLAPSPTISWLWQIYKQYYNTSAGAADEREFITNLRLTGMEFPA